MTQLTSPLKNLKVAAPCSANWDEMFAFEGERIRFCSKCNLNVYNLSAMQKAEAEALILQAEGRLCVRFYRRADGSVLTQNCPVGLQALKARLSRRLQFVFGMMLGLLANLGFLSLRETFSLHSYVTMGAPSRIPMGDEQLKALQEKKTAEVVQGRVVSSEDSEKRPQQQTTILKLPRGKQ